MLQRSADSGFEKSRQIDVHQTVDRPDLHFRIAIAGRQHQRVHGLGPADVIKRLDGLQAHAQVHVGHIPLERGNPVLPLLAGVVRGADALLSVELILAQGGRKRESEQDGETKF